MTHAVQDQQERLRAQLRSFTRGTRREAHRRRGKRGGWLCVLSLLALFGFLSVQAPSIGVIPLMVTIGLLLWTALDRGEISPDWVQQGETLQEALTKAPKELLPELFSLGAALEKLPVMAGRRNEHRKANRMTFELQEMLFLTLNRLLAQRSPQELGGLDGSQRAFLRRAIFRTADSGFVACALLVLATLQDTALQPQARELAERHPSERIREAAREYLGSLTAQASS